MNGRRPGRTSLSPDPGTARAAPDPPAETRWFPVAMAVLAGVLAGVNVGKVAPALPVLRADLGIDLVTAGWVASAIAAAMAALGLLVGMLADRMGAARLLGICVVVLACGGLLGAAASGGGGLVAGRLVEAVGFVGIVVAAPRMIVLSTRPEDRGLALGIWAAYMPCGMAIAMLAAPPLLAEVGWRGLWIAGAALAGLYMMARPPFFVAAVPASPSDAGRLEWRPMLVPGPWLYGAAFLVYSVQWFAVMTWLPTLLIDTLGMSAAAAPLATAGVVGINAFGNVGAAWLLHRGTRRWLLVGVALGVMALSGGLLFSAAVAAGAKLPLAFVFSFVGGMLPAAALSGAPAHMPGRVALANGIVVQFSGLGSLLGPPVMAAVVGGAAAGWHDAWQVMAVSAVVGAGLVAAIRRVEHRR